jgi:hypothetical protein
MLKKNIPVPYASIPVLILTSIQRRGTKTKPLYKEEDFFLKEEFSLANEKEKI